jgi:hypothetical protein
MKDYVAWLKGLGGQPIFVAHPVAFDYAPSVPMKMRQ